MKSTAVWLVPMAIAALGLNAFAQESAAEASAVTPAVPVDSAMQAAIATELAAEAVAVEQLGGRIATAPDPATALGLVRELEARKLETFRRLLDLQLARARGAGNADLVAALEATLAVRDVSASGAPPAPRPTPPAVEVKGGRP